jgi:arabinogalactan endo-1,4-beta-galactosidase
MADICFMKIIFLALIAALLLSGCKKDANAQNSFFAKGADIGWLSEMESAGIKFRNAQGQDADCISILKSTGMNTIRLRVWVDPKDGWCGEQDVVKQAVRAKNMGMKLMIDFHYSDWWADPGKQNKPAAWVTMNVQQLLVAINGHTKQVITTLKQNGVTPDWVQVGNETNDGMLWETGRASKDMKIFADMVNAGYEAVKEISPSSKVIVHISNGYDNKMFRWMFDGLTFHKARFDVIGMSLYPEVAKWQQFNEQTFYNMTDMINRYGKEVMICEVGMPVDQAAACKLFLTDLISKVKSLPGNKGLGVLYWEPECHNKWKGYKMGAFDETGKPTVALDAFRDN